MPRFRYNRGRASSVEARANLLKSCPSGASKRKSSIINLHPRWLKTGEARVTPRHPPVRMLRFGLLKYKKLNSSSSGSSVMPSEGATLGPCDDNGNQQQTSTPVRHYHQQIHNQLNGSPMKNVRILRLLVL